MDPAHTEPYQSYLTQTVLISSCVLLGVLIPVAILFSRDKLRDYRRGLVLAMEAWIYKDAAARPMTSFEAARIKYEMGQREPGANPEAHFDNSSWKSYVLPGLIYASLVSLGFITALFLARSPDFWTYRNFILSGMGHFAGAGNADLIEYQENTGAAITAGFIGSFLFTLQYLLLRVRSYELSPISFLAASVTLLEGCFVVAIARHLVPWEAPNAAFAGLAFVIGYVPTFGVSWLFDRLNVSRLKKVDPEAYDARRVLPIDMIDGIDIATKFRLLEAGVRDVQNLATANPVLLYVETPYNLLSILDWMAQAQLIASLGNTTATKLRAIGVRSIPDLALIQTEPLRAIVLRTVWPDLAAPSAEDFETLRDLANQDLHVRRLAAFLEVMSGLMDGRKPPAPPIHLVAKAAE